jgi:hypothetical protein
VKIEKGSEIYITYTHTLNPTLLRRDYLKQCKFFDCICSRCSDPTELGTNMSSLKCNKCDPGLIMSSNPLGEYMQPATQRQLILDRHKRPKRCQGPCHHGMACPRVADGGTASEYGG